jgi:hypothetical protein
MKNTILTLFVLIFSAVAVLAQPNSQSSTEKRPMSFLDMRELKRAGSYNVSTDGKWLLFTVSTPNWENSKEPNGYSPCIRHRRPSLQSTNDFLPRKKAKTPRNGPKMGNTSFFPPIGMAKRINYI